MNEPALKPASHVPPEGASAFPPPTPSLSSASQKKEDTDDMDTREFIDTSTEELVSQEGSKKRKFKTRNHSGPKRKKLNLHNCTVRTLAVSARTPVRILMEIGQQQKFEVDYKFTERERKNPFDDIEKGNSDNDIENGTKEEKQIKEEKQDDMNIDEDVTKENDVSKENGTEKKEIKQDFWTFKRKDNFSCTATLRGEDFIGVGYSKQVAKNAAAEEAIKALVVREKSADAVPWSSLACLGLYKVFTEWESQGATLEHLLNPNIKSIQQNQEEVPQTIQTVITGVTPKVPQGPPGVHRDHPPPEKKERKPKPDKRDKRKEGPKVAGKMPTDPTSRHPVQLLNELHPGLDFVFLVGGENNYDCKVNVETMDFCAKGKKNKKDAKKFAAMEALRVLYNVTYPAGSQFG